MRGKKRIVASFSLVFILLAGCSGEPSVEKSVGVVSGDEASDKKGSSVLTEKIVTLNVEDKIMFNSVHYQFAGFSNKETMVFQGNNGANGYHTQFFHPAEVGYEFSFSEESKWRLTVLEANRKQGFIKLKMKESR